MATPETIVISASNPVPEAHRTIGEPAAPPPAAEPDAASASAEPVSVEVVAGTAEATAKPGDAPAGPQAPPRTGPGSGKDAWAAYATEVKGLAVPADATRDEIIALVDAQS